MESALTVYAKDILRQPRDQFVTVACSLVQLLWEANRPVNVGATRLVDVVQLLIRTKKSDTTDKFGVLVRCVLRNCPPTSLPKDHSFWDRLTRSLRKAILKTNRDGSRLTALQALDATAEHVRLTLCQDKGDQPLDLWVRHRNEWLQEIEGLEAALSDREREWVAKIKEKLSLI